MSTNVVNEFHALPDRADDVMNLLIDLPDQQDAARMPSHFTAPQPGRPDEHRRRYALGSDYDNYLARRTDSGYTAQFDEMLTQPMCIRYFDEVCAW